MMTQVIITERLPYLNLREEKAEFFINLFLTFS